MIVKVIDWSYVRAFNGKVPGYGACRAVLTPNGYGEYANLLPVKPTGADAASGFVETAFSGFTFKAPLPNGKDVIYLRIPHNPGDGRIAGGDHGTDQAIEWDVNHWAVRGTHFGPNGLVYGRGDFLTICKDRPEYQRTGGWYNGIAGLVPCVGNNADPARGLWEFTDFGDVAIGQTSNDPGQSGLVGVSFRRRDGSYEPLQKLDPRTPVGGPFDAHNVLVDRSGDLFGITAVDYHGQQTYHCWATWDELKQLPR